MRLQYWATSVQGNLQIELPDIQNSGVTPNDHRVYINGGMIISKVEAKAQCRKEFLINFRTVSRG
jgi:hypothetical protein